MRKSELRCCTSDSLRRMSGANTLAPSRSGLAWAPLKSHEPVPAQPRTDSRNAYPNARPHFAAQYSGGISIYRAPLLRLSPYCLPTGSPLLSTAPRSPSSRLVPLVERTTSAAGQRNSLHLSHPPPEIAASSDGQQPFHSTGLHPPRRLPSATSLSSQTAFPPRGSTLAAGIAANPSICLWTACGS